MSGLSVVSWEFLAVLAAGAIFAWVGAVWLIRRRRPRSPVLVVAAVMLSVLGVATSVNRYYDYLPRLGDVASVVEGPAHWPSYGEVARLPDTAAAKRYPRGVVVRLPIPDGHDGLGRTEALVWLPRAYFAAPRRRFASVYLIHGSPGVPADWFRGGRAAEAAQPLAATGRPMIVVAPRMSRGWRDDSECVDGYSTGSGEKAETHLMATVLPTVDSTLRTVPRREARAIGGMSAGGFCALNLGLRHRSDFGTILDFSGLTAPTHAGGLAALFGEGKAARAAARRNTPSAYAKTLAPAPRTRIWLDCGRADGEVKHEMESIYPTLANRGLDVSLNLRPGAHTFHVWVPALRASLAWAAPKLVSAAATGTPS